MEHPNDLDRFPDDCLPPEGDYDTRDALLAAINAWAIPRGYVFTTAKSTKERSGKRTVTYICDRGGQNPDRGEARQRITHPRRIGCQFSVLAKESLDRTRWFLRHRAGAQFASHNHEPARQVRMRRRLARAAAAPDQAAAAAPSQAAAAAASTPAVAGREAGHDRPPPGLGLLSHIQRFPPAPEVVRVSDSGSGSRSCDSIDSSTLVARPASERNAGPSRDAALSSPPLTVLEGQAALRDATQELLAR